MPSLSHIIEDQQQQILDVYLRTLEEDAKTQEDLKNVEELKKYLPSKPLKDPHELVEEFLRLDKPKQVMIAKHLARIADIQSRVRNTISSKFATGFADQMPIDAYSLRYTLQQFTNRDPRLSSDELRDILGKTIISNSVTAHPTNPYSKDYTIKSMELDHILAEEKSDQKIVRIKEQVRSMIATDPTPSVYAENKGKKTQEDEVLEAMSYMRNIYEQLPIARRDMQKALELEGYGDVKIGKFYEMAAWLAGDGDGNPAATAESLQQNIDLFKKEIIGLYVRDLEGLEKSISESNVKKSIGEIIAKLDLNYNSPDNEYKSPEKLIEDLNKLLGEAPENAKQKLEDLIYRVENFGFRYAKIDIRHDAGDISIAAVEVLFLLEKFDENTKKDFLKRLKSTNEEEVKKCCADIAKHLNEIGKTPEEIFAILDRRLKTASENDKESLETARRVFGRLQVVARNPGCSDKLIIAECKNSDNALAAMWLLKASGNTIQKEGSLNIVTLSESAEDLLALEGNIEALLRNQTYRDHVVANGKLFYMIAKSDTQRRGGSGAQYTQEVPPEKITKLLARLAKEFPELKKVTLVPFNGGGHALQRGGGRIDEIPNVYAKAAMRGLRWLGQKFYPSRQKSEVEVLPPLLTTQGHQNGILFSAANAGNFLTSYLSQSIYAKAKMDGLVEEPEVLRKFKLFGREIWLENDHSKKARANRKLFFEAAKEVYENAVVEADTPINILFRNGPWAGIALTNVSSRPGARSKSDKPPQLIDQRAIGVERMCAHSGTHLISWYSARAGFKAIIDQKGLQSAQSMYTNDKATRDSCRSMAMSLFMTDFDVSWKMMIGEKRPDISEIKALAREYDPKKSTELSKNFEKLSKEQQAHLNKVTLAHIEMEAIETAKLIYTIAGGKKELTDLAPKELLKELWSNLATEIENREVKLKFAHLAEAAIMADLPVDQKRSPTDKETQELIRYLNTACVGTEAPTIAMISSTKRIGDQVMRIPFENAKTLAVVGDLSPETAVNPSGQEKVVVLSRERSFI